MPEYDNPWKFIIERYFRPFMEIVFPDVAADIDWTRPIEFLESELQQIHPDAATGRRTVDKLVAVHRRDGTRRRLLIHLEFQSQRDAAFERRMFEYFYRILDRMDEPLASLAVLGDDSPKWRPNEYRRSEAGCELVFRFPTCKLLDLEPELARHHDDGNVIATIIEAHLQSQRTTADAPRRGEVKLGLLRRLYQRGLDRQTIRDVFAALDWMLDLSEPLRLQFRDRVAEMEKSFQVQYVTSIERDALAKGREEGRVEGRVEGIDKGVLIGRVQMLQEILGENIDDRETLAGRDVESLSELHDALRRRINDR